MSDLKPIGPEWTAPSALGFQWALCEKDGEKWLCFLEDEREGWQALMLANEIAIEAFRWCQQNPNERLPVELRRAMIRSSPYPNQDEER